MRAGRFDCLSAWRGLCADNAVKCSHGGASLIATTFDVGVLRVRSWTWGYSWSLGWGWGWNIEYSYFRLATKEKFSS